jgi:uncharacterized protein YbjT (DUF2867 family)
MKIALFGGTGKTGKHLMQQALDQGHSLRVLVRSPEKVTITHDNLKILQ